LTVQSSENCSLDNQSDLEAAWEDSLGNNNSLVHVLSLLDNLLVFKDLIALLDDLLPLGDLGDLLWAWLSLDVSSVLDDLVSAVLDVLSTSLDDSELDDSLLEDLLLGWSCWNDLVLKSFFEISDSSVASSGHSSSSDSLDNSLVGLASLLEDGFASLGEDLLSDDSSSLSEVDELSSVGTSLFSSGFLHFLLDLLGSSGHIFEDSSSDGGSSDGLFQEVSLLDHLSVLIKLLVGLVLESKLVVLLLKDGSLFGRLGLFKISSDLV